MERLKQRDRLIEILDRAERSYYELPCHYSNNKPYIDKTQYFADYLLANDVNIPLCKVGDTVYVISRGDVVPLEVDSITLDRKGVKITARNEKIWGNGTINLYSDNRLLEWYTTREEAEKELESKWSIRLGDCSVDE